MTALTAGRRQLTFTADPGKLAHFGTVEIVGNKSVDEHIIRRQLTFKPGELFQRSVVQDSQRRLYGLELFQFANVEPLNSEQQPDEVPVRVTVAEGKHQHVNFGVGYGTEEKARVDAEYHHVNFLGGARTAGAHVRWSSLDRGVRLDFNQPYFFRPRLSLGAEGQQWWTYTPAYTSVVSGVKLTLTHRSSERTSWGGSITSEHDVSSITDAAFNDPALRTYLIALGLDPTTKEQNGNLNALGADFQHSTADNLLNAHRGFQLALHAEEAGRLRPGDFNYYSGSADFRQYLPISDSVVLASRAQIGNIRPAGDDPANVPFAKKYFLGGATSIRGWGRYEVSPLGLGRAGRRQQHVPVQRGSAGRAERQFRRRVLPRRRQRLGQVVGFRLRRFAICDRSGAALPDADRTNPPGPRLSVESHTRSGRERKPADAPLSHSLQHRAGVLGS